MSIQKKKKTTHFIHPVNSASGNGCLCERQRDACQKHTCPSPQGNALPTARALPGKNYVSQHPLHAPARPSACFFIFYFAYLGNKGLFAGKDRGLTERVLAPVDLLP